MTTPGQPPRRNVPNDPFETMARAAAVSGGYGLGDTSTDGLRLDTAAPAHFRVPHNHAFLEIVHDSRAYPLPSTGVGQIWHPSVATTVCGLARRREEKEGAWPTFCCVSGDGGVDWGLLHADYKSACRGSYRASATTNICVRCEVSPMLGPLTAYARTPAG